MIKDIFRKIYYEVPSYVGSGGLAFPCRNVNFELTYGCNLNCSMCAYKNEVNQTAPEGSDFEPLRKDEIIKLIRKFPSGSNITFTGGEIFLKEGILEILEAAAILHKVTIATNGTLVTKDIAKRIVELGIALVGLSLDGPEEVHNKIRRDPSAYDKLIDAIGYVREEKKIRAAGYPLINLNGVILEENHHLLYRNIEIIKALGLDAHTFQICDPSWSRSGWRLSDNISMKEKTIQQVEQINRNELSGSLEKILNTAKRLNIKVNFLPRVSIKQILDYYENKFDLSEWQCLQPWSVIRISPYGDVFPCLNYNIGNIRNNSVENLWNNAKYRLFRKTLKKASLFDSCVGCCKMIPKKQ